MTNYELNLKYKCKLLTSSYLFFLLLLIVSGSFKNAVLSNVFYYLAFVMPIISVTPRSRILVCAVKYSAFSSAT